jgi:hypothetical protein
MTGGGMVYSEKMHSSFLVNQNIVHSSWLSAATDAAEGAPATLAAGRARFITPGTTAIIMNPLPTEVKVSDHIEASPIPASLKVSIPHAEPCKTIQPHADWLEQLSRAIPRHLREQIFGDLCEIRAEMVAEGRSPLKIGWTTFSQFLLSILWWLWTRFGWVVLLYNRVSEWLSPNK